MHTLQTPSAFTRHMCAGVCVCVCVVAVVVVRVVVKVVVVGGRGKIMFWEQISLVLIVRGGSGVSNVEGAKIERRM